MPQSFTIECPRCAIRLHCQPSASGKRLQCPQCQAWMMVPDAPATAYEVPVAEIEVAPPRRRPEPRDEFTEFGSYEMYLAPPRPRRRQSVKKKKQANWVLPVVIGGSCVLGLLLIGAVIYTIGAQFSVGTLGVDEPLAYVTDDTELVVVVHFDELKRLDEFGYPLRNELQSEKMKRLLATVGVEPDDISMIAVGLTNARDENDLPSALRNGAVVLIQSKKKLSRWRLSLGNVRCRHAGKEYLRDRAKTHGVTGALFFANERTIVAGTEPMIKKLLELDRPSVAGSRFAFADFAPAIVVAYAAGDHQSVPTAPQAIGSTSFGVIKKSATAFPAPLRGLALSWKFEDGAEATACAACASPREAAGLAATLMQSPRNLRTLANSLVDDAAEDALRNRRITTHDSTVVVSLRIPKR
jgi:hypothetical protein